MAPLGLAPKTQHRYSFLDKDKIEAEKQTYKSDKDNKKNAVGNENDDPKEEKEEVEPAFVSTNDIVTSWFLQQTQCTFGFMAVNFRNRLEGHTHQHAGNYEHVIFYYPPDYETPQRIRKSHTGFYESEKHDKQDATTTTTENTGETFVWKRAVTLSTTSVPSFACHANKHTHWALVTNWSSFAQDANLPQCVEELHAPLLTTTTTANNLSLGILFRVGPNNQKALLALGNAKVMKRLRDNAILEKVEAK